MNNNVTSIKGNVNDFEGTVSGRKNDPINEARLPSPSMNYKPRPNDIQTHCLIQCYAHVRRHPKE